MDFDVIVIGSGFGGAVTACRLAESGRKVLILERGRRWTYKPSQPDSYPRMGDSPEKWIWDHRRPECSPGWFDLRPFPNMTVAQGAGVGGGSLLYANVSVEAPAFVFDDGWPKEITAAELRPYYDTVRQFMMVGPVPENQMSGRTRLMKEAAEQLGAPERFRLVELAVNFDPTLRLNLDDLPSRPADGTVFAKNKYGVEQGTCYHCGLCDIGCDVNARNTLDTNYIPWAEKHGAEVRPLHLVSRIEPLGGGYRVHYERLENGQSRPGSQSARLVIIAAGSLGSTELLLRCRDQWGTLPRVSPFLGRNWSSNGDFLTPAFYHDRDVGPSTGLTITSSIDFFDGSRAGQRFWIQDGGFPDVLAKFLTEAGPRGFTRLKSWILLDALRELLRHQPARHIMPWFAQGIDAADGVLRLQRRWWLFGRRELSLSWDVTRSKPLFDEIGNMHKLLSEKTGGKPHVPWSWSVARDLITPHPLGGCNMGEDASRGVVNHAGEIFGYPNLYVSDAAVIPRAIGVNPSRTIAALAERSAGIIVKETR